MTTVINYVLVKLNTTNRRLLSSRARLYIYETKRFVIILYSTNVVLIDYTSVKYTLGGDINQLKS